MNKLSNIIIELLLAGCVMVCVSFMIKAGATPPEITEVSTLTCDKGAPHTYYGFDANYHIGYCGKSILNSEWVAGPRKEVVCTAPEVVIVTGSKMECG